MFKVFLLFAAASLVVLSSVSAMEDNIGNNSYIPVPSPVKFLDPQDRPESIQHHIDSAFSAIERKKMSSWGIYNGSAGYYNLDIEEAKLAKKIIEDAHKAGRKDVYILDSGAGDFQSCDAFAKYINEHCPTNGMTVHVIGTRGECYEGAEVEKRGICNIYKFGSFKIENHQQELKNRGLDLVDKIDLTISNWATRHLVDPLGTWLQFYHTTRPGTGLLLMDWAYYLYEGDDVTHKVDAFVKSRDHLLDLLLHMKMPFLLHPRGDGFQREVDRFLVQRLEGPPLKLPLSYQKVWYCDGNHYDIGSGMMTVFKVLDKTYTAHPLKGTLRSFFYSHSHLTRNLFGNEILFQWLQRNNLMRDNNVQQFFKINVEKQEISPLYSEEEMDKMKQSIQERRERKERLEKEIDNKKRSFLKSLPQSLSRKLPTPIPPTSTNGPREIEDRLWMALRAGNFEQAQALVSQGADVNRIFDGFFAKTFLDYAIGSGEFPKGTIEFLLKNKARVQDASLDSALYQYKFFDEVKLLIDHGIKIKDVDLALARAANRGDLNLMKLFMSMGANINTYSNCLPMIYSAQYCPMAWDFLVERGATDGFGRPMQRWEVHFGRKL